MRHSSVMSPTKTSHFLKAIIMFIFYRTKIGPGCGSELAKYFPFGYGSAISCFVSAILHFYFQKQIPTHFLSDHFKMKNPHKKQSDTFRKFNYISLPEGYRYRMSYITQLRYFLNTVGILMNY